MFEQINPAESFDNNSSVIKFSIPPISDMLCDTQTIKLELEYRSERKKCFK